MTKTYSYDRYIALVTAGLKVDRMDLLAFARRHSGTAAECVADFKAAK